VPADSAVLAALAAALPVLHRWGDRWYLFGAQAVAVWGRPRMSADVDVTAEIAGPPEAFVTAMLQAGFDLRVPDWQAFLARTRVLPFLYRAADLPLDVVLAGPGLEQEFLDRAVRVEMAGITVPVISPEDLVVTKLLAGRPKDVEDVRTILEDRHARLDLERVRALLHLLEQILSRGDLVPELERLLAAARSA
jgi:Nucleotidyltransferase of unknown function (DUF6036)